MLTSGLSGLATSPSFTPLAAGHYCGQGLNSICVDADGTRNGAYGPGFKQTDLKLGYQFRPAKEKTVDANLELFNVFNVANFNNPTVDSRLTDFLVLTALSGGNGQPRAAQFSVRFGF